MTVVEAVEVLLPATGSGVAAETVAEFSSDPACAGAVTTIAIVVDAPVA